jgi:two-component system, NtrC family, response regulator HupR/HoxA
MDSAGTVLIFARDAAEWTAATEILSERSGYRVLFARTVADTDSAVSVAHVDLVIAEVDGESGEGMALLLDLRISHPEIVRMLVLTSRARIGPQALAQAAIYQYLRMPLDAEQLGLMVKRGLEARELARRHRLLSREFKFSGDSMMFHDRHGIPFRPESQHFEKLVYVSEKMAELCDLARKAARTELPILIQGETGTGKELLARAIHYNSTRQASPLMAQNCGGMPDELLQSELFGHKRGAYTGAISDRLGLFRAADGGTVFLDEISEVSTSFQVSLLRFLQEGEVKPLGSDKTYGCNVRIIAASNRPLRALVDAGQFRQDLYFRLKGFVFEVPALRERPDDIPALAEFFAAKHSSAIGRKILGISAGVLEKLMHFDFPGNIRELENEIHRMVALARDGEYLTTQHMSPTILVSTAGRVKKPGVGVVPDGSSLKERVENLEKHLVSDALSRHRWNQSRAADELGLSRVGLANKIKRYGLDGNGKGAERPLNNP